MKQSRGWGSTHYTPVLLNQNFAPPTYFLRKTGRATKLMVPHLQQSLLKPPVIINEDPISKSWPQRPSNKMNDTYFSVNFHFNWTSRGR
jgi:hypothetical protein